MEKRENPVCHFVTPLDGNMHLDVHRAAEVRLEDILTQIFFQFPVLFSLFSSFLCCFCSKNRFLSFGILAVTEFDVSLPLPSSLLSPYCDLRLSSCLLQTIASDGRCWKRRIEIVIREYHKWRTYFKKRVMFSLMKQHFFCFGR